MAETDTALDLEAIARARTLVAAPQRRARTWPVLAAAALAAISALSFATAMVLAPPLVSEHIAESVD